jgi:mevalonate kinase
LGKLTSKILLFGEYTVLRGSAALAMPFPMFGGHWAFPALERPHDGQQELWAWLTYLKNLQNQGESLHDLDLILLEEDLEQGMYFKSNIPTGYGLGSSGALCAALFTRYALKPISADDVRQYPFLKKIFAQLESFFHGSSSGLDPLICYLNRPVLLKGNGEIEAVKVPAWPTNPYRFFLLDTQQGRITGPLVQNFLRRCEDPVFAKKIDDELCPLSERAIELFCNGEWENLYPVWQNLSRVQADLLAEMIPTHCLSAWENGLLKGDYALKLCGAGGGGFLLGMGRAEMDLDEAFGTEWLGIE